MKKIGFLSFGHWTPSSQSGTQTAADTLLQSIDLAVAAEELGGAGDGSRHDSPGVAAGMLAPTAARGVGPNRPQRHQSQCGQRFRSILHRVAEWSDHIRRLDGVPVTASRP